MRRTIEQFKGLTEWHKNCDYWGNAMAAFFDVAGEMAVRCLNIPHEWGYQQGLGGADIQEWNVEYLQSLSDSDLLAIGNLCHRLTGILDRKGFSY